MSEIVGLSPGALTGVLDMLENEDVVRVLSSPRVVTMNNTQAAINQTQQIPISQSNATAGSVSFRYRIQKPDFFPSGDASSHFW